MNNGEFSVSNRFGLRDVPGDPTRILRDSRLDPRIRAALDVEGEYAPGVAPVRVDASYEECVEYCTAFEKAAAATHTQLLAAMPDFDSVATSTEVIRGDDGNDITLYIYQPLRRTGPVPCIVYAHGGGMVFGTARDPMFVRLFNEFAARGLVVVGVEFRNGAGECGNHPFPAGLNDCASAVRWTHANRTHLDISSIVIAGESGGGNLSAATAIKAAREGWVEMIDGVYAMCPYICGAYADPPDDLVSLRENDGYMLSADSAVPMVKVYDPTGEHAHNPLAWPLQATPADLQGLPPHVISVNELDPLRDEGLAFYRKLLDAGVSAVARTVHGTPHGGDLNYPDVVGDVFAETVASVRAFAYRL